MGFTHWVKFSSGLSLYIKKGFGFQLELMSIFGCIQIRQIYVDNRRHLLYIRIDGYAVIQIYSKDRRHIDREMTPEDTHFTFFQKFLPLWVSLCMGAGILIGRFLPSVPVYLDRLSVFNVSIPIGVCLFMMMYPIMVKIDFARVIQAGKNPKPIILTLLINWALKPFTMYGFSTLFLGYLFRGFFSGTEVLSDGSTVEVYRSYVSGAILLGIAPCTAMVLVWSFLARGNDALTLIMVAINSLTMLALYAPLGGLLLRVNKMPIPWEMILLSVGFYIALPLGLGYITRREIVRRKGERWFREKFTKKLDFVAIGALLATLILPFSLKGNYIVELPMHVGLIAVPLLIQTFTIFGITYFIARLIRLPYEDAAPSALVGASNHFEIAIASAVVLYGLNSGAALATVVGVLTEVPIMLSLVWICLLTRNWFPEKAGSRRRRKRRRIGARRLSRVKTKTSKDLASV